MMRISWHKSAIKQWKNGCKKAEDNVIKIISDRTSSQPKLAITMQMRPQKTLRPKIRFKLKTDQDISLNFPDFLTHTREGFIVEPRFKELFPANQFLLK